jgi:hypothetical protein
MVLDGKDYGIGRADESASINRFHNRSKWYFGSKGMAMINQWGSIVTVPAIKFYASASR